LNRALELLGYGARQAAALSYYAIFSVFPPAAGDDSGDRLVVRWWHNSSLRIGGVLPPSSTETLELADQYQQAIDQGGSFRSSPSSS
jgi:hypothetical protein